MLFEYAHINLPWILPVLVSEGLQGRPMMLFLGFLMAWSFALQVTVLQSFMIDNGLKIAYL